MQEIECVVTGKVTNVMFRDFIQRKARGMWVTGTAENIGSGTLKVIAQGPEEKLDSLVEALHKGPFLAKVKDVSVEWREPRKKLKDFKILY